MTKQRIGFFKVTALLVVLCGIVLPPSVWAQNDPFDPSVGGQNAPIVRLNGKRVAFVGQQPIEDRGRVLVPLRGILEKLGAFVQYDTPSRTITAIRGRTTITLPVGATEALIGQRTVTLDTPARAVNGTVLVPLRFLAEALGANVRYDNDARTVNIRTSDDPPGPPDPNPIPKPQPKPDDGNTARTFIGTVVSIYPNLSPRRLVLRVRNPDTDSDEEQTIPAAPDVSVFIREASAVNLFEFNRITRGDKLRVRTNVDGDAETIYLLADDGQPTPLPEPPPKPKPNPDPLPSNGTRIIKGDVQRIDRVLSGLFGVVLTSGKIVAASRTVPVTYAGQKLSVTDLQKGDRVTIIQDAKTLRAVRITIGGVR